MANDDEDDWSTDEDDEDEVAGASTVTMDIAALKSDYPVLAFTTDRVFLPDSIARVGFTCEVATKKDLEYICYMLMHDGEIIASSIVAGSLHGGHASIDLSQFLVGESVTVCVRSCQEGLAILNPMLVMY